MDILSVSAVNFYVKSIIEEDPNLKMIFVEGEISNFVHHYKSGHLYFSLKDSNSVIRAVMFSRSASYLKFQPKDGMKVIVRANISLYEPTGQYQLIIDDMQPSGIGLVTLAYEQLKEKLSKLGLFDEAHKKKIPKLPSSVGVITSENGAAFHDICNVISRRFPFVNIILYDSAVQGENSAEGLIKGLKYFESHKNADVVIIGRGGGSIEDLQSFNDEKLAYEIYNFSIPIISAVGHETDFTICDFVSDLRAPTPSAAAELAVPDYENIKYTLNSINQKNLSLINKKIDLLSKTVKNYSDYFDLKSFYKYADASVKKYEIKIAEFKNAFLKCMALKKNKLNFLTQKLEILNPKSVLSKGYSIVLKNDKLLKSVNDVFENDRLTINFSDGKVDFKISEINKK